MVWYSSWQCWSSQLSTVVVQLFFSLRVKCCVCMFLRERKNVVSLWRTYKWVLSLSGQDVGGEARLECTYADTHTRTDTHVHEMLENNARLLWIPDSFSPDAVIFLDMSEPNQATSHAGDTAVCFQCHTPSGEIWTIFGRPPGRWHPFLCEAIC